MGVSGIRRIALLAYPKVTVRDDRRVVDNGRIATTAGVSDGIDGALHLVGRLTDVPLSRQQGTRYPRGSTEKP